MVSSRMTGFRKNEDCPSSQELLDFQKGVVERSLRGGIRSHLVLCEFCAAEVEFYSYYPQEDSPCDTSEREEIPAPLYQLAEALLKNRHDASSLNSLIKDKAGWRSSGL